MSITTVSRVLNNHPRVSRGAREKVLAAANEARYVPPVAKRSTSNIALVYTGEVSVGSPFDSLLMFGMSAGLEERGDDLMVIDARRGIRPGETYSQMFMRKGVRGVVLRTTLESRSTAEAIVGQGFPAVVVGDRLEHPNACCVGGDSREPSREAVEHLIQLGHTRIAVCLNVVDDADHADRLAGYRQAMTENGLEVDRRMILRTPANRRGGMQLMRRLAALPDRPTALFVTDPSTAAGVLKEARDLSLDIPGDMSIVGFDDGELRFDLHPELTAVVQDTPALGREALSTLYQVIEAGTDAAAVKKSLPAWLEVHASTAPPPGSASD